MDAEPTDREGAGGSPRRGRRLLAPALAAAAAAVVVAAGGVALLVTEFPGEVADRQALFHRLQEESVVTYEDGRTPLGSFFLDVHRRYLPYASIPTCFVQGLMAAEDRKFLRHHGVDPMGILRALGRDLLSLRFVAGGSTLTQQTAKILFGRRGRTLGGKARELVNALRLERFYSKQEILEFYANQFFVSGNGVGLAVASRYFFDKDPRDLDVGECAYLAGIVKGPNRYNPLIQKSPEERAKAEARAKIRRNYVLGNLKKIGWITEDAYARASTIEVPFHPGEIRFESSVALDAVRGELVDRRLAGEEGGEAPGVPWAGGKVVTTLDPEIQEAALYALRKNLVRLDVELEGLRGPVSPGSLGSLKVPTVAVFGFYLGVVTDVVATGPDPGAGVDFGGTGGWLDLEGLLNLLVPFHRYGGRGEPTRAEALRFLKEFHRGQIVYVSVREETPLPRLDLEQVPRLEGGMVVLQEGRIRGLVGGFSNQGFDRALEARRPPGSAMKPIVYLAALQLGWSPLDPLENRRNVFPFEGTVYFPRPDHPIESPEVSLAWAGVRSENVASVYLLSRLCDRLTPGGFQEVAGRVGLAPRPGEDPQAYTHRIRDEEGIVLNDDRLRDGLFDSMQDEEAQDLAFSGGVTERAGVLLLKHGNGLEREIDRLEGRAKRGVASDEDRLELGILRWNFLALRERLRGGGAEAWAGGPEGAVRKGTIETIGRALEERLRAIPHPLRYDLETLRRLRDFRTLVGLRYVALLAKRLGIESPVAPVLSLPLGTSDVTLIDLARAYGALTSGKLWRFFPEGEGSQTTLLDRIESRGGGAVWQSQPTANPVVGEKLRHEMVALLRGVVTHGTARRASREVGVSKGGKWIPWPVLGKTGTANDYRNATFVGVLPSPTPTGGRADPAEGYVIAAYVGYDLNQSMAARGVRLAGAAGALPGWILAARRIEAEKRFSDAVDPDDLEIQVEGAVPLVRPEGVLFVPVDGVTGLPLPDLAPLSDPASPPPGGALLEVFGQVRDRGVEPWRDFEPF